MTRLVNKKFLTLIFILRNVILSEATLALHATSCRRFFGSTVRISEIIVETLRSAQGITIRRVTSLKQKLPVEKGGEFDLMKFIYGVGVA